MSKELLPKEVSDGDKAFGGIMKELLPAYNDIPEDFKSDYGDQRKWVKLVSDWFFIGLPQNTIFTPKQGIDKDKALRHIMAIMRSWVPKHQHKTAGVAYLLSLWFEDVSYTKKDMDNLKAEFKKRHEI